MCTALSLAIWVTERCMHCVPKNITDDHKAHHFELSCMRLICYTSDKESSFFSELLVRGGDLWNIGSSNDTWDQKASIMWEHFISPSKEMWNNAISKEENATVILYYKGVVLVNFVICGDTNCWSLLWYTKRIWQAICWKNVWVSAPRHRHFTQQCQASYCQLDLYSTVAVRLWTNLTTVEVSCLVISIFLAP